MERLWRVVSLVALAVGVLAVLNVDRADPSWPYPDAPSYVQLADNLASGDGYRVDIEGEPEGSRYPPGFPLLLAALSPLGDPITGALLLAAALVVAVWVAARRAGGDAAATVAVALITLTLTRLEFAGTVMADAAGALFVVLALIAVQAERHRLAGVLVGFGAWVRLAHVVVVSALPRRAWATTMAVLALLAATKVAWGWGYRGGQAEWSVSHLFSTDGVIRAGPWPNPLEYLLQLLGAKGALTLPGAALVAGWAAWRRPERRFVAVTCVGVLAVYLPYFYQAPRFLVPVAALIAVYAGAGVGDLTRSRGRCGCPTPRPRTGTA